MENETLECERIAGVTPVRRSLSAGSLLFAQGDRTRGIFRLLSGGIQLVRTTPDGAEVPMHMARPGELFAEASLFSPRYHCDARAVRNSVVLAYPRVELSQRLKENPEVLWSFAATLAQRVQGLRTRMELRQTRPASDRVLQFLRLNYDADGCWRAQGTLKQVADELGMTHEALYRALATLVHDGSISRQGAAIRILPPSGGAASG